MPLADPDGSQSLLAFGESATDGSASEFNQQSLWEQAGLKPSPIRLATLQNLGIVSTLTFSIP